MNVKTVVALQGEFDATFPNLRTVGPNEDRVPGRDLAECVLAGLKRRRIDAAGPFYEEPFFELRCHVGEWTIKVLCYIYEPEAGTWVVEVARKTRLLARLRADDDSAAMTTLVEAIHETLLADGRVREARWFSNLPGSPFGDVPFSHSPFAG